MTIKRLLRQFTLLSLCVILTQLAFSQTKTITGKVSDAQGAPVQGATVSVKVPGWVHQQMFPVHLS